MSKKQVENNQESKIKLLEGIKLLHDSVVSTLGPAGKNVVIEDENGDIHITKDGVTVAKSINVENTIHDLGIKLIKQAAIGVNDVAGDGTTTATVLAYELLKEGMYILRMNNKNSIEIQRGINQAVKYVSNYLTSETKQISNDDEIKNIALISSNNDEEIASALSEAIKEVGRDGVIMIEDSRTVDDELEIVSGLQFNKGFSSNYFITDNNTQEAIIEDARILVYNGKISYAKQLLKVLEYIQKNNERLVVIADDIEGEALGMLIINRIRGNIILSACNAPEYGEKRKQFLYDVAAVTNATVIDPNVDNIEENFDESFLGRANKVKMSRTETTIIDGAGSEEEIEKRAEAIKHEIEVADTDYAKKKLKERLAKLVAGVAIIRIAAESELELNERKDRLEDALNATKAAVEDGILPGGGIALLRVSLTNYQNSPEYKSLSDSQKEGFNLLMKALPKPFEQLLKNANIVPEVVLDKIKRKNFSIGYNIRTDKIGDMLEMGIIDPAKVIKVALQKAASVAGIFLTADTFVLNIPDKDTKEQEEE